jgi:hypothetical protein
VRDTSVAVSMARSAIPGCDGSVGSMFTFFNSLRPSWVTANVLTIRGQNICSLKLSP